MKLRSVPKVCFLLVFSIVSLTSCGSQQPKTAAELINGMDSASAAAICTDDPTDMVKNLMSGYTQAQVKNSSNQAIFVEEIREACTQRLKSDSSFKAAITNANETISQNRKASLAAKKLAMKFKPELDYWNKRAESVGQGTLSEYLDAISHVDDDVKSGQTSYQFTGASTQLQSASCQPTDQSKWIGGYASGWWMCLMQFLGQPRQVYSIQIDNSGAFSNRSWAGSPDGGTSAGSLLNWNVPQDLQDWMHSTNQG